MLRLIEEIEKDLVSLAEEMGRMCNLLDRVSADYCQSRGQACHLCYRSLEEGKMVTSAREETGSRRLLEAGLLELPAHNRVLLSHSSRE